MVFFMHVISDISTSSLHPKHLLCILITHLHRCHWNVCFQQLWESAKCLLIRWKCDMKKILSQTSNLSVIYIKKKAYILWESNSDGLFQLLKLWFDISTDIYYMYCNFRETIFLSGKSVRYYKYVFLYAWIFHKDIFKIAFYLLNDQSSPPSSPPIMFLYISLHVNI